MCEVIKNKMLHINFGAPQKHILTVVCMRQSLKSEDQIECDSLFCEHVQIYQQAKSD